MQGVWFSGPEANIRRDLANKLEQKADGTWVWRLDPALFGQATPPAGETERLWAGLAALDGPVLEVRGADSHFVSDDILDRMRAANPRLASVDVAKAAHIVPVDNPAGFVDAISPFLGLR
jgi:pimeloyl-ACP methyl ester carboxylesterase